MKEMLIRTGNEVVFVVSTILYQKLKVNSSVRTQFFLSCVSVDVCCVHVPDQQEQISNTENSKNKRYNKNKEMQEKVERIKKEDKRKTKE